MNSLIINNRSGRWYRKSKTQSNTVLYFKPLNEKYFYFKYNNSISSIGDITHIKNGFYKTPKTGYYVKKKAGGLLLYKKRDFIGYFVPL